MGEAIVSGHQRVTSGWIPDQAPAYPAPPAAPVEAQSPVSGADVPAEAPSAGRVIVNGKDITVLDGSGEVVSTTGFPFPSDIPPGVENVAEVAIVSFAMMVAAFPIFGFLKAIVNRRPVNAQLPASRDTTDRLARIEAAVDAMSVEVERISEGQRFVTRALSERSSAGQ